MTRARRRIAVLGLVLALCASAFAVSGVTSPAFAAHACGGPLAIIGVPGSGTEERSAGGYGDTVAAAIISFRHRMPPGFLVSAEPLRYPASPVSDLVRSPNAYHANVDYGVVALEARIEDLAQCQHIVLFGHSSGALVINRALVELSRYAPWTLNKIAGVGLFSDPNRLGWMPINRGNAPSFWNGVSVTTHFFPADPIPSQVWDRTESVCVLGDFVCAMYPGVPVSPLLTWEGFRLHSAYASTGWTTTVGHDLANVVNHDLYQ